MTVEVSNASRQRVDLKRIARAVRTTVGLARVRAAEISVAVVGSAAMRRLNRQFLGHDYVTDVLSFLYAKESPRAKLIGEIVICADLAVKRGTGLRWSWQDELLLYVVHGTLHLVGYNDSSAAQRRRMQAAEQESLSQLGVSVLSGSIHRPRGNSQ